MNLVRLNDIQLSQDVPKEILNHPGEDDMNKERDDLKDQVHQLKSECSELEELLDNIIEYPIYRRDNKSQVLFTAEIESDDNTSEPIKKGLAVKWAINHRNSDLRYADLSYADMNHFDLMHVKFQGSDLKYADFSYSHLNHSNISRSDLTFANFTHADFELTIMSHSNMKNADLSFSKLLFSDLTETNLCQVNFTKAVITHTDFTDSPLTGVIGLYENETFDGAIVKEVKKLQIPSWFTKKRDE